jgi:hypothetical protein
MRPLTEVEVSAPSAASPAPARSLPEPITVQELHAIIDAFCAEELR